MEWIKLSCALSDHRKIKIIRAMPEGNTIALLWVLLLLESGKSNRGGFVMVTDGVPYSDDLISQVLGIPLPTVRLAIKVFDHLGMIEHHDGVVYISNWTKYQSEDKLEHRRQQDRQRKQVQRNRERERQNLLSAPPTVGKMSRDTSRDVTEQTRSDQEREITTEDRVNAGLMSLLSSSALEVPTKSTIGALMQQYGAPALITAVDAAASAAKKGRKIENVGGYLTALCRSFVPPEGYVSLWERQAVDETAKRVKDEKKEKEVRKVEKQQDEIVARNRHWDSLSAEEKQRWQAAVIAKMPNSEPKVQRAIEVMAKMMALQAVQ